MNFKHFLLIFFGLLFTHSCKDHPKHQHGHDEKAHEHKHGHANEYMHQSDFEELVNRFESKERTAYQKPEQVMSYFGNIEGKKVMDIGAGTGYFSFRMVDAGASVIAADVDDQFLEFVTDKKDRLGLGNDQLEVRKIPYDSPSLSDDEVDIVLIVNTYHHIENRVPYFKEVKSGLKDGGRLIVIDFFKKETPVGPPVEMKISSDKIVNELKDSGFEQFEINKDLLPYQFIITAQ
jgi:ubiquinone/menaquinone biosynthesis C-methylase UbiE